MDAQHKADNTSDLPTADRRPPTAPIAVICALEAELRHLRAALPTGREVWHAGRRWEVTTLGAQPIILARCGIGMLSAAAITEATIGRWSPAAILNYGCTGAHRDDLLPGDLVIAARVVAYDNVKVGVADEETYWQMRYLRADVQERADYLLADPALLAAAERAAAALAGRHEPWPPTSGWPEAIPHRAPTVRSGTVASADRWNRAAARIGGLVATHDSACEDMEAAAIALTCASHNVPFLAIKDISNNELLRVTDPLSFDALGPELGRRAAALTLATLRQRVVTGDRPSIVRRAGAGTRAARGGADPGDAPRDHRRGHLSEARSSLSGYTCIGGASLSTSLSN
jgi:adenosylhomocysteine nucleosidase